MSVEGLRHCLQIQFSAISVQPAYRFSVRIVRYRKLIDPGFETEAHFIIISSSVITSSSLLKKGVCFNPIGTVFKCID
jgi:hypothetical protein